jgi:hypothetical protein
LGAAIDAGISCDQFADVHSLLHVCSCIWVLITLAEYWWQIIHLWRGLHDSVPRVFPSYWNLAECEQVDLLLYPDQINSSGRQEPHYAWRIWT